MLSKQYIISLAMDSPWLTTVLKKKIDQKFWLNDMVDSHPSGDETLEIHVLFRNQLLNNPQGLSRHEVLVGGSKRDSKGKKIMQFTKGMLYEFEEKDGEWEVLDDNYKKELFSDPYLMFRKV